MNTEPTTKRELLEMIGEERAALEAALAPLSEAEMLEKRLPGGWSVKDVLAHITSWEQLMVQWTETSLRGEIPERPVTGDDWVDELNARLHDENEEKPLAEVLQAFADSHRQALQVVERLTEADLFDPGRFSWRDGLPLWQMVAANTNWHYKDHRDDIADL